MCKTFVEKYKKMSDSELIIRIRDNDQDAFEALFYRYLPLIKNIVSKCTFTDNDADDLMQDATISFYYATQMFDSQLSSFSTFLSICVERSLRSTIRKSSAKKRIPERLIVPIDDNSAQSIKAKSAEEEFFIASDSENVADNIKGRLSSMEYNVLKSFLNTESYDDTAAQLQISRKSVDNALVRIRKKLNS